MGKSLPSLSTLVLTLSVCWQTACTSTGVSKDILGDYQRRHPVRYFDGEILHDLEETDTIHLRNAGSGKLAFTVAIVSDNGHTCRMDGVAAPIRDGFEYREVLDLPPADDGKPFECILRLKVGAKQVTLQDLGHNCRLFYCGVKAKLNGLSFVRIP